jgi:hypothetical protein
MAKNLDRFAHRHYSQVLITMATIVEALGLRWRVACAVGACSVSAAIVRGAVPDNDPASLARAMSRATGGIVQP